MNEKVAKSSRRTPKRARQLGVSDDEYARLLAAQGGHCALCLNRPKSRRLHVDHDHMSKPPRVRGLLCHRCNRALPTWVTAGWLLRAARYVGGTWEDFRNEAPRPEPTPRKILPPDLVTKPLYTIGGTDGQARIYQRERRES